MLAAETDTEKPKETENSENVDEISDYSAQLLCAVIFHVPAFRNLSLKKHLIEGAKLLKIKSLRGCGKYELAKKIAISLVNEVFGRIQAPINFRDLTREQIIIIKELQLPSPRSSSNSSPDLSCSSSYSTESVNETDDSFASEPSDE